MSDTQHIEREEDSIESLFEDSSSATEDTVDTAPLQPAPDVDIPDKYQGKSQAELVAMLSEAERFNGKQANEIGDLRKSVDSVIQAQLNTQQAPAAAPAPAPEVEAPDYFDDPAGAINAAIDKHPEVVRARDASVEMQKQTARAELSRLHPDMASIVADEDFGVWVSASPIRQDLLKAAQWQFNVQAAHELLSNWKELQSLTTATLKSEKQHRSSTLAAAGVNGATASASGAPAKKYRRADIVRLMTEDPERYASMADTIQEAYASGNVIS